MNAKLKTLEKWERGYYNGQRLGRSESMRYEVSWDGMELEQETKKRGRDDSHNDHSHKRYHISKERSSKRPREQATRERSRERGTGDRAREHATRERSREKSLGKGHVTDRETAQLDA